MTEIESNKRKIRGKKSHKKGLTFEERVAKWAKRKFKADDVYLRTRARAYARKQPCEIDVHVHKIKGFFGGKSHDIWIECKNVSSSIKHRDMLHFVSKATSIEYACELGIEEFYFDYLIYVTTSRFDHDALFFATKYDVACYVFENNNFILKNDVDWIDSI